MSSRYRTIAIVIAFLAVTWYAYTYLPVDAGWYRGQDMYAQVGLDWKASFRPAAQSLLRGESPYGVESYFSPPWVLLPLLPLVPLPVGLSSAILFAANWIVFVYVAHRLGMRIPWIVVFPLTGAVIANSYLCNIDGLAALGLAMPPQIGLFFVLSKPQIGWTVALYWLIEAYRRGGWRECVRVFAPVAVAGLLSLAVFGLWPLRTQSLVGAWWNFSIFPYGIPVGLLLMVLGLRYRKLPLAVAAAPYLSPFLSVQSWSFTALGILAVLPDIAGLWQWIRRTARRMAARITRSSSTST